MGMYFMGSTLGTKKQKNWKKKKEKEKWKR